jgi:hypothetical protein
VVLLLALVALLAVVLLAALLFDSGLDEVRSARADFARARAASDMERALADLMSAPPDSALAAMPVGRSRAAVARSGFDSTSTTVQPIGHSILRLTVTAHVTVGGARARQGTVAFALLASDTVAGMGTPRLRPIGGAWRFPLP